MHLQHYYNQALTSGRKDGKGAGLSARSVQYHHRVLHKALDHAYRWQLAPRNVADLVDPPKAKHFEPVILDLEGVMRFLGVVSGHRLYPLYVVAIATGLRQAEILGLRWEDVDLARGTLTVRQTLQYRRGFKTEEPKTRKSRRPIALPLLAIEALEFRKHQQEQEREGFGQEYVVTGLVFGTGKGTPLEPRDAAKGGRGP